jgi:hypothetical protein
LPGLSTAQNAKVLPRKQLQKQVEGRNSVGNVFVRKTREFPLDFIRLTPRLSVAAGLYSATYDFYGRVVRMGKIDNQTLLSAK